jgi:tRNA A58 N-methylase Trm61
MKLAVHRKWLALAAVVATSTLAVRTVTIVPPGYAATAATPTEAATAPSHAYEVREDHDPNGTGKFYFGREIAQILGHSRADWLERPQREEEENTALLVETLKLKPGEVVADIGAGTGYLSRRFAVVVGGGGQVLAEDIQPEMLDLLRKNLAAAKVDNVKPILGTITDPKLPPSSVDSVVMVDVYHEFSDPHEMLAATLPALKPGGRVIFVEFRAEDPNVPIKRVHKMTEAQVRLEAEANGLAWLETIETLPRQHVIVFKRKPTASPAA